MSRRPAALAAALLTTAAPLFGSGCRGEEEPVVRQRVREATITAEVRSRLLAAERLRVLPLGVETRAGTVRVTGAVHDSAQVQAIRALAEQVRGVERLDLRLEVVPPPDSAPAQPGREPRREAPVAAPAEPLPSLEEAG